MTKQKRLNKEKRKIRRQENKLTEEDVDAAYRDITIGKCMRRKWGKGVALKK